MYHHRLHQRQNDTVSTQPVLEPAANSHRLLSPTDDDDDKVSRFPSSVLPAELIVEILQRLPVVFLLQFRCVSKSWKTLISDLIMSHQRLAFCGGSCPLRSLLENPTTPVIPDNFSDLKHEYCVIGSCNGLLCLFDLIQDSFMLYNPSINFKSKNSPILDLLDWLISHGGFGYDQVNDKYKVFVVLLNLASNETLTKIYTFGEDSWRTIQNFQNFSCTTNQSLGKYVSGTLNWVGCKGDVGSEQYVILSFDMEKETYREVLLPQNVGDDYMCIPLLYVLSNCLCVCFENETNFVVWLMKEYGVVESWTKLTIIPREKFMADRVLDMLFISENGVILMRTSSSQLVLYNINSGRLDYSLTSGVFNPYIYHTSLISPQCEAQPLVSTELLNHGLN